MAKILTSKFVNTRERPTHKYTFTYADLTGLSGATNVLVIPDTIATGDLVKEVWVNATSQFNVASLTSCKVSVGDGAAASNFVNAIDVGNQVGINQFSKGNGANFTGFAYSSSTLPANSTSGLVVTVAATGVGLSAITSGSCDIYYTHISVGGGQAPLSGSWINEFFW